MKLSTDNTDSEHLKNEIEMITKDRDFILSERQELYSKVIELEEKLKSNNKSKQR